MKITRKSTYLTNGRVYVRLGYFSPPAAFIKKKNIVQGDFNCSYYPRNTGDIHFLYHSPAERGIIPLSWLVDNGPIPAYLKGFIAINKRLIPKHILTKLQTPTTK